jgi:glycine oxidase
VLRSKPTAKDFWSERYDRIVTTETDVLVVGAGIIGCAIARELASRGVSVQVLDARGVGRGATQASAGILAPYIEGHEGGTLLELTVRSLDLYDAWIETVRAESGIDVEYQRSGSLEVALDPQSAEHLIQLFERFGRHAELVWLDASQARTQEPALSDSTLGALSVPTHGYVAAPALTEALACAAHSRGAVFHHSRRVRSVHASSDRVEIHTHEGESYRASRVVMAAGSWTGGVEGLSDAAAREVRPVRGQLLRVRWRAKPLEQIVWGPSCYLVPWRDGTVLVGATMEEVGFDERNTAGGVRTLLDAARTLVPGMDDATFLEARAGLRPATSDGLPLIGFSDTTDLIVYATGHYRNGVLLAPLTAKLVGDLLVENRRDEVLGVVGPGRGSRVLGF